jgi:heme A synthase
MCALLGGMSEWPALRAYAGVGHALMSHLFFALVAVVWAGGGKPALPESKVEDGGWPSLRSLASATPAVILVQIALGAAYRHQLTGVLPHVIGAFLAAVFVLMAGAALFTANGVTGNLKKWAGLSLGLLLLQILLGVGAYFARVSSHSQLVPLTVSHVIAGATLLAVNCILSTEIWKEVVTVRHSATADQMAGSGRNG